MSIIILVGCCGNTAVKRQEVADKSVIKTGCIAGFAYDPEKRVKLSKENMVNVIARRYWGRFFSSDSADTTTFSTGIEDSSGFFILKDIPEGKYRVEFSLLGYYAYCINVIVIPGFTTFLDRIALQLTALDWEIIPIVSEGVYVKGCDRDSERIIRNLRLER
jgi:hypothetical protein